MKKISIFCISLILSITANAQNKKVIEKEMYDTNIVQRDDIIRKNNPLLYIGWNLPINSKNEIKELNAKYLPLSNYLSQKLNSTIVMELDKSDSELAKEALNGDLDLIYTTALRGVMLINNGFVPIVGRSESIRTVLLTNSNANIKNGKDWYGKKIVGKEGDGTIYYLKYSLLRDKGLKNKNDINFEIKNIGTLGMLERLDNGLVQGVALREKEAKEIIKNNNKYKIAYVGKESPGNILFAKKDISEDQISLIKNIFLNLIPDGKEKSTVLKGLDDVTEKDLTVFKSVNEDDLLISVDVATVVGIN